jgi:hypothetical protein
MRLRTAVLANPLLVIAIVLALAGVAVAAVPAFQASEKPTFCNNCHEMQPYYTAWTQGSHKSVDCVACHVDGGTVNHIAHKVEASKELWIHLTGDPRFPGGTTDVPNARCLACHKDIPGKTGPRFSHKAHVGEAPCIQCHATAGHQVSLEALGKAGVLATSAVATAQAEAKTSLTTTGSMAGHVAVSCTKCHGAKEIACSKCHTPPHDPRGECTGCHAPGTRWVFTHPTSTDCASCHKAPARHFPGACTDCHSPSVAFKDTKYAHDSSACASCHASPSGHSTAAACAECHRKPGTSWAFSHPSSKSCASCHSAPRGHYAGACATCHSPSIAFKKAVFRHTAGSNCASCHKAPSGHNAAVACASCHRKPGVSWAASHPSSSSCSSCHKPPASHYGTGCSSCHRVGVAWRQATFSHPRVQHGYKAFACVKCHPSGYRSHSCTTCHGPEGGDD